MASNKEKNFISAIVYVRNSAEQLEDFLNELICTLEESFEHSEIICVNDGSTDSSVGVIKEISKKASLTSISIVNLSYFHGLEIAMNAGTDLSIGDFVIEFDNTELDYTGKEIMNVYYHALEGYDIVTASSSRKSKTTSKLFYKVFDLFSDVSLRMQTESFRVLSRRVINRVSSMNKTIPFRKAVYANSGLKTDTVVYESTKPSNRKIDKKERKYRRKTAMDALLLFTDFGYFVAKVMTCVMFLVIIATICYTIWAYIFSNPIAGWTSTILFLAIAFLGLFAVMTVVIKYLQLIVNLVFKRKQYSFENIEKITR